MSTLLPAQIPPQGDPVLDSRGRFTLNWWLFLYNLANKTLGDQPDITGLLILLSQAFDSDTVEPPASAPGVPETDYPVVFPPDGLALFPTEVPPNNQAQAETAATAGGSPFVYTAPANGTLLVTGGTVSQIEIARSGTYYTVGTTIIPLARLDKVRVTWSGAPTLVFFPS